MRILYTTIILLFFINASSQTVGLYVADESLYVSVDTSESHFVGQPIVDSILLISERVSHALDLIEEYTDWCKAHVDSTYECTIKSELPPYTRHVVFPVSGTIEIDLRHGDKIMKFSLVVKQSVFPTLDGFIEWLKHRMYI